MSQISAATFRVLRARANKKERMNEISHTNLMLALRNRAEREQRELRGACAQNDKLNAHFQSLNAELDRLAEAPLHTLDQSGEVVTPASKENKNGLR